MFIAKSSSIIPNVYNTAATQQKHRNLFPTETKTLKTNPSKDNLGTNTDIMDDRRRTTSEMDRLGPKPMSSGRSTHFVFCPSMVSGMEFIRNPRLFKGMAFNLEERQGLGTF